MKDLITIAPSLAGHIIADSILCGICIISLLMQMRWLKERKEFQKKIEAHETILKTIQAVTTNEPDQEPSPMSQIKVTEDSFKERLDKVMDKYISDENFNVTVMTKELGMSRTALFTKIKNVYGISPQTYITNYRLSKAAELLKAKEHNVSEISEMVGFATITGFSRSFKNRFGMSPSAMARHSDKKGQEQQAI
jgi:AraC-like DNA-binding protein